MVVRKNLFGKALQKANNLVHRLDVELQGTERLAAENQIAAAYELSLRAAETSERLTLVTRTLPAYTGSPQRARRYHTSDFRFNPCRDRIYERRLVFYPYSSASPQKIGRFRLLRPFVFIPGNETFFLLCRPGTI